MEKLRETLAVTFKIRPGEGLPTILLLIHSFFMGASLVFFETSSYALFLTQFSVKKLPVVYILSSIITSVFGFIYSKLEEKLSFSRLLIITVGSLFASIASFYVILLFIPVNKWMAMILIIWYNVVLVLTGLEFWSLASHMLNVRQGKRLFGLIGTGEIFAGIICGFMISFLAKKINTSHLILISALGMLACLITLIYTSKKLIKKEEKKKDDDDEEKTGSVSYNKSYLGLIFSVASISILGYYILDYIFYDQLERELATENEIASFLGMFIGIIGIVTLISNAFLYSRFIERYGIGFGLLAVPVCVVLGTVSSVGASIGGAFTIFFYLIIITKGFDEVCRVSIEEPSLRILYQPFPPEMRMKAQTLLETMIEPLAGAFVGALLILLTSYFSFHTFHLVYLMCFILIIWIAAAISLRGEYTVALTQALAKRRFAGGTISMKDKASIELLQKKLTSDIPGEVINCLNLLEDVDIESLEKFMVDLLNHPAPEVRQHVLERIGSLGISSAADYIKERLELEKEKDSRVIGTALRTLCAVAEAEAFDLVYSYLEYSQDIEIKKGAMAGLLSNGGIDGVLSAGANLNLLLESKDPKERKLAAQVLGEVGISSFYRPLLKLLKDNDKDVRAAAIIASGRLKNPRLLPLVMENFSVPDLGNTAFTSVINFGEIILPELETMFDKEDQTRQIRIKLIRIMGRIGGDKSVDILKKKIDFSEEDIRSHVLAALVSSRYQADINEISTIYERIRDEVADATWTLSVLMDIGEHEGAELLVKALKNDVEKNRKRIFSLLALIYSANSIIQAQLNLESKLKDRQANALEVLDNIMAQEIKPFVMPLLDDIPASQRHSRLVNHFPQKRMSRHERLKEILARSQQWTSSWTKTCALFVVGKIATKEFFDSIISCLSDSDSVVRETAVWALGCLNPDDLVQRLQIMKKDKSKKVAECARFVINSVGFSSIPMGKGYLTRTGKYTAELFINILQDNEERRVRRCRAANILSRFQLTTARDALLNSLAISDKIVRTAVLDALIKGKFLIEEKSYDELTRLLNIEFEDAKNILGSIVVLLQEPHSKRLIHSLKQEINHNRKRILSIMALLCSDHIFIKKVLETLFYWYVHQENKKVPDYAEEWFKHLLKKTGRESDIQKKIMALFKYQNPVRLKEIWEMSAVHTPGNVESHLKKIAFGSSVFTLSWSRICALDMIVNLELKGCVPGISELLENADDIVRATSAWALFKLDNKTYQKYAGKLRNDSSYLVSRTAKQLTPQDADMQLLEKTEVKKGA